MVNNFSDKHERISRSAVVSFFNSLAPGWDSEIVVDSEKIHYILDKAGIKPGVRVLDVACGTGVLFPFYIERKVASVTAVDISPEMARIAASKATDAIKVVCGDIEEMPGGGDFDCCVVYNAFPHFPEPERLVRGLAKWLKPGGRLTIAHSMGIAQLNRHHAGRAANVSRGLMTAQELAKIFEPAFVVDTEISDDEKYIVSGTVKAAGA